MIHYSRSRAMGARVRTKRVSFPILFGSLQILEREGNALPAHFSVIVSLSGEVRAREKGTRHLSFSFFCVSFAFSHSEHARQKRTLYLSSSLFCVYFAFLRSGHARQKSTCYLSSSFFCAEILFVLSACHTD